MSARPNAQIIPFAKVTRERAQAAITEALNEYVKDSASKAKVIAELAGSSHRTAEKWLRGHGLPSAEYLINLEARIPGLQARMRQLRHMEEEFDPDFQRALSETQRILMQFQQQVMARR